MTNPASSYKIRKVEQLVLQGTPFCNLNCTYCDLSETSRRTTTQMPLSMVVTLIGQLAALDLIADDFVVVWHSGEPLTLPVDYYAEAIDTINELCAVIAPSARVKFDFQTNATLINERWCSFFEKYADQINLGVSCDGPDVHHDAFRIDWKGRATHARALEGMRLLEERGIRYNAIAVVTGKTLADPENFLSFFYDRRQHLTDFHFNILASPVPGQSQDLSYSKSDRDEYLRFYKALISVAERQAERGVSLPIRNLEQTRGRLAAYGLPDAPEHVRETSAPLRSLNMDALGNLTTFYAGLDISYLRDHMGDGEGFSLGNINKSTLATMLASQKFEAMRRLFEDSHDRCAKSCEYYSVCPGGFELTQLESTNEELPETLECLIHVKTLTDAIVDFVDGEQADDLQATVQ